MGVKLICFLRYLSHRNMMMKEHLSFFDFTVNMNASIYVFAKIVRTLGNVGYFHGKRTRDSIEVSTIRIHIGS